MRDAIFARTLQRMKECRRAPRVMQSYEDVELQNIGYYTNMRIERKKGEEKGRKEGEEKGRKEQTQKIREAMAARGYSPEEIRKILDAASLP